MRLFFLILFLATTTTLPAQIEWNPVLGGTGGAANYYFGPAPREGMTQQEVRLENGWLVGLDVRIGGRTFFLVPGVRWQRLDYRVQVDTGPGEEVLFREGDAQILTLPLGVAYRLREASTSFNLNLHGGVYYQLELSQSEVLSPAGRAYAWHPDSSFGLRLGVGLDLDWLTLHLDYWPRLNSPEGFAESGGYVPRSLAVGVRF